MLKKSSRCAALAGVVVSTLALLACSRSEAPSILPGGDGVGVTSNPVNADFHTLRTPPLAPAQFEMITLSTLPDTVTDGDVLLGLRGLAAADTFTVKRNGEDVTSAFKRQDDGSISGLVSGLAEGANTLVASATGAAGTRRATLGVVNHPISGPVISGPHQTPFICRTKDAGLGDPIDADCSVKTTYQWFYRSSQNQAFKPLADPYAAYPADTITTQTRDGRAVPFVVRVESATINRGIARISVLDDPAARGAGKPFAATQWNHRIYYVYGESCGVGYQQGVNDPSYVLGAFDPATLSADKLLINLVGISDRLGKGDVIVHSTLSAFGTHCNPIISIETAMMIKEHVSEQYGPVQAVVGTNGSGAALQQYNAVNNAPGLIDAAMPTATFADILSTAMTVSDCGLLTHYYANGGSGLSDDQHAAIDGHNLLSGTRLNSICDSWTGAFLSRINAHDGCDGAIPDAMRYDAKKNPQGVRCTIQDANVNIFGRDPATGFAKRPLDNSGVQYGLAAYNSGAITADEFIALNRDIGGFDIDGGYQTARHRMDAEVEHLSYLFGGVIGRGALAETPVLDLAPYLDLIPTANIHEAIRPFTVRARLQARATDPSVPKLNQVLWRGVVTQADAYPVMEQWLDNVRKSNVPYGGDHRANVIASKTTDTVDRCTFGTIGGRLELPSDILLPLGLAQLPLLPAAGTPGVNIPLRVDVPEQFDTPDTPVGPCQTLLPVTRTPRMVAGMPLTDDIIKCQLKAINPADYNPALSAAQLTQLTQIFPEGVCDFSKPAAGDVQKSMIWPSFGGSVREVPHELHWRVARSQ
jgi:hypothetical protein